MGKSTYLDWVLGSTPTKWWHDSAEAAELDLGLERGASGVTTNPYLAKVGGLLKPETMLVIGLFVGGYLARRLSGQRKAPAIEHVHAEETSVGRRYLNAFLGGVFILFGARLAGGCTSGHIISGITQLALSGMLFAVGVFGMGIVTARLMKGGH